MMSGSGLSPWSLVRDPASHAENVARNANCYLHQSPPADTNNLQQTNGQEDGGSISVNSNNAAFSLSPQDLLKCLRDRPLEVILKPQSDDDAFKFSYEFGPSVDGVVIGEYFSF